MCSCFLWTQNALFLSASSRSCDDQRTALLRSCISDAGVSLHNFRQRMQLANGPANFAVPHQYGATVVWTVLYLWVSSVVTFTWANVASCVAPGCRRFRSRCGHVKVARPLNAAHRAVAADAAAEGRTGAGTSKSNTAGAESPAPILVSLAEDEGIEKSPSGTERAQTGADERNVAKRGLQNLLP